jgi:hypothetical protein
MIPPRPCLFCRAKRFRHVAEILDSIVAAIVEKSVLDANPPNRCGVLPIAKPSPHNTTIQAWGVDGDD